MMTGSWRPSCQRKRRGQCLSPSREDVLKNPAEMEVIDGVEMKRSDSGI